MKEQIIEIITKAWDDYNNHRPNPQLPAGFVGYLASKLTDHLTAEQGDEGLDLCPKCNSLGEWSDERDGGGNPLYKCVECGTYF